MNINAKCHDNLDIQRLYRETDSQNDGNRRLEVSGVYHRRQYNDNLLQILKKHRKLSQKGN